MRFYRCCFSIHFFPSLIFLPFILLSAFAPGVLEGTMLDVPVVGWEVHKFIIIKSFIVLSSWILGYFGMKHLPITIVGPINATRPVMVLVGAMLVFGERLNLYQWIGVMLAIISFFMLSRSGKKEGIDFKHNKWILFIILAAVAGAVSGLYDKYLMKQLPPMVVQSWYNVYQMFICVPFLRFFGGRNVSHLLRSVGIGLSFLFHLSLCCRFCLLLCIEL